ncbi:MAG: FAD-binding protein, partial [Acidobacteriota bacterium]|nr:FAD-binding protein [Acidobacteriota bacterium]
MYDVIIIGAGPAGLSAALWCDELGLDALVLEQAAEVGG